jgi:hypothetical protein
MQPMEMDNKPKDTIIDDTKKEGDVESRIMALEQKLDKIISLLGEDVQEDKTEGAEVMAMKKGDDKEDKEDKKDKKDDKKDVDKEASAEGGKVKLPQSKTGETDEEAKHQTDKVNFVEKRDISKMVDDKVRDILKGLNLQKSTTPRTGFTEVAKSEAVAEKDLGMDIIKRAKEGKITHAGINQEIKKHVRQNYDQRLKRVLGKEA